MHFLFCTKKYNLEFTVVPPPPPIKGSSLHSSSLNSGKSFSYDCISFNYYMY